MKDKKLIPIIRKNIPKLIAEELVNIQPMSGEIFKDLPSFKIEYVETDYKFGDIIHNFIQGYMAYNGNEFIAIDKFRKEYPEFEKVNVDGWVKMVKNSCRTR